MSQIAFPFLTLGPHAIHADPWEVVDSDGTPALMQRFLTDWDYQRPITFRRTLRINREIAAENLGIQPSDISSLNPVLRIGTGPGNIPRSWIGTFPFSADKSGDTYHIEEAISGEQLSTRVKLETILVLETLSEKSSPLSPRLKCARVWTDETDVNLEGVESRFPVESVSFSTQFAGQTHVGSTWYLYWNPARIHDEFAGTVRLFLNADNESFIERFTSADPLTLQSVMAGVMTQMAVGIIMQPDLHDQLPESEPGSVGYVVNHWLQMAFPDDSIASISSRLRTRPSFFHACMLAAADLQGD